MALYTFFGGAPGILLVSILKKQWNYGYKILILAIIENFGIYVLLYELAIHVADQR